MFIRVVAACLALTYAASGFAADTLGNGAVADQRRLGTAELMLLCAGGPPMAALTRQPLADAALTRILLEVYPCNWDEESQPSPAATSTS